MQACWSAIARLSHPDLGCDERIKWESEAKIIKLSSKGYCQQIDLFLCDKNSARVQFFFFRNAGKDLPSNSMLLPQLEYFVNKLNFVMEKNPLLTNKLKDVFYSLKTNKTQAITILVISLY